MQVEEASREPVAATDPIEDVQLPRRGHVRRAVDPGYGSPVLGWAPEGSRTGRRHLSWGGVDAFQASVMGPRRLTPALPTTSQGGGHYPLKQGGRFARNRRAKPVKSAARLLDDLPDSPS
jgi:hypothetical protein